MNEQERHLNARREERRRRERRRKKRIRAVLLLILFIAVIVIVLIAFSSCHNKKTDSTQSAGDSSAVAVDQTPAPEISASPDASADPSAAAPSENTSLNIPSPSEENDLLEIIEDADANGGEKTCYLTFDDGPSESVTPVILDVLRRYNVKATFFTLGSSLEEYPDMARRLGEEGHLIANHSYSHNYDKLYATEESFITEVNTTEDLIAQLNGGTPAMKLFRFPGGSYNAGDHASEKQVYKQTLASNGFYYIDWNSLTGDAEGAKKDADGLLAYLQSNIDTSSSTVVLMHDAEAKKATAEALPMVIEYLMSEGYAFKRLDEIPYNTAPAAADTASSEYSDSSVDSEASGDSDSTGDSDSESSSSSSSGTILNTPSTGTTTRTSVSGTSSSNN